MAPFYWSKGWAGPIPLQLYMHTRSSHSPDRAVEDSRRIKLTDGWDRISTPPTCQLLVKGGGALKWISLGLQLDEVVTSHGFQPHLVVSKTTREPSPPPLKTLFHGSTNILPPRLHVTYHLPPIATMVGHVTHAMSSPFHYHMAFTSCTKKYAILPKS
jgi:hypothetical protein